MAILATPVLVDDLRACINRRLDELVPSASAPSPRVAEAARYALLAPGKRIRPLLTLFAAMEFGAGSLDALDVACATEMVHTASLVLDDLPSMDNARLRRGQQTTHVRFGESTAILAAVALLNQAFATVARTKRLPADTRLALIERLADAVGFDGLITGQEKDLNDRSGPSTVARLETLNHQKTSVLFQAALEIGAHVAGAGAHSIDDLRIVARHLGLAYQIADDLYDGVQAPGPVTKDRDQDRGKPTLVSLLGVERARERFGHHLAEALRYLPCGDAPQQPLRDYITATFVQAGL